MTHSNKDSAKNFDFDPGGKTAILVDGGFFIKRYQTLYTKKLIASQVAKDLYTMVHAHVKGRYLYRIFYYDCFPFDHKVHKPISNKILDFSKSDIAEFRNSFFKELKKKRKLALRLGELRVGAGWLIKNKKMKDLINGKINITDLTDDDFQYDLRQKAVDIKIGCDIAALAYKKLVNQIILVSGDSDFVPAAKVARREGIDFILDPMWNEVSPDLFEHIDGLKSTAPKK